MTISFTILLQVIGFLAAVLHKTGTWEDVENNRPLFLQSQMPSKESNPNKVLLLLKTSTAW